MTNQIFQQGDKVRVIGNNNYHGSKIGDVVTINYLLEIKPGYELYTIDENPCHYRHYDLELVEKKPVTFTENVAVECRSKEIKETLLNYAKSKGVPVYKDAIYKDHFETYPNIVFSTQELCGGRGFLGKRNVISTDEFLEYCDNWEKLHPKKLKLNSDYEAELDLNNKVVKVGCQKIAFDKVLELAKMINEAKYY